MPRIPRVILASVLALVAACSSSSDSTPGGKTGGSVQGAADTHCIDDAGQPITQASSQAACNPPADAGAAGAGGDDVPYGDTRFNQEADDDDCKYHVKWTASAIRERSNVTFTVEVTQTVDGSPLTGAYPRLEVYLDNKHPAPNTPQQPREISSGKYTVGPIQFDAPGRWTVRFHFYEDCVDLSDDSPHGHVAFYIDVP